MLVIAVALALGDMMLLDLARISILAIDAGLLIMVAILWTLAIASMGKPRGVWRPLLLAGSALGVLCGVIFTVALAREGLWM